MTISITNRIREATKVLHRMVEQTGFIPQLFRGEASKESYAHYLLNLEPIYQALEKAMEKHRQHPMVKPVYHQELFRGQQIKNDLTQLFGKEMQKAAEMKSSRVFVRRIEELQIDHPELLGAHAYTRYLADLSGGQMLSSLLQKKYQIPQEALTVYRFDEISNIKDFVSQYHQALDTMIPEEIVARRFIDEVLLSYFLNLNLSMEMLQEKI